MKFFKKNENVLMLNRSLFVLMFLTLVSSSSVFSGEAGQTLSPLEDPLGASLLEVRQERKESQSGTSSDDGVSLGGLGGALAEVAQDKKDQGKGGTTLLGDSSSPLYDTIVGSDIPVAKIPSEDPILNYPDTDFDGDQMAVHVPLSPGDPLISDPGAALNEVTQDKLDQREVGDYTRGSANSLNLSLIERIQNPNGVVPQKKVITQTPVQTNRNNQNNQNNNQNSNLNQFILNNN